MRINHNISALNTYRQLSINNSMATKSLEKLSSGMRINRAADDAAGLAISEKMRGQIRGLNQAVRNAQDGISLIQTAEGALNETHSILQRMRELAVQAANDTNTLADRREIQKEINQLIEEIDRIAATTEFNTKKLLNGDLDGATSVYRYQTGAITGTNGIVTIQTGTNDTLAFNVNGQAKSITLDAGDYTIGQLAQMIQSKLNESADLSGMTVAVENGTLVFEAKFLFATEDSGDSTANSALAISDSKEASLISGDNKNAVFQIGANEGQVLEINIKKIDSTSLGGASYAIYRYQTGAITGTNGIVTIQTGTNDTLAFNVNGQAKSITLDAGDYTIGQLAQMIQSKLNESADLSGMTVAVENGTLVFEAKFLFATEDSGDSTANSALAISDSKEASKVASSETIKSLFVANVDTATTGGVLTKDSATAAITNIDAAIQQVSAERSKLGAYQNRLEHTINNLGTAAENLTAAESRIRDVDMAQEMMEFTKLNILQQAATAMLAQANQMPQAVLQLLR
jgi:flagellin